MTDEQKCKPMREKTWLERDTEQKLEALRQQVVYLTNALQKAEEDICGLLTHRHGDAHIMLTQLFGSHAKLSGYHRHIPTGLRNEE